MPRLVSSLLCGLVCVASCGDSSASSSAVTFDTLPSGAIVVTNRPPDDLPVWRLEEDLRLGRMEGEGPDLFGDVRDLAVDGDGRLYLLEAQAQEVRIFDADGGHVATVGRKGEGPGEFTNANGIALGADGLLRVPDPSLGRVTFLRRDGALERTEPVTFRSYGFIWSGGVLDDGRFVDTQVHVNDDGSYDRVYRTVEPGGEERTVLAPRYPEDPRWQGFQFERGSMALPFGPQGKTNFLGDGTVWSTHGVSYEMVHRTLDGDTLRIVRSVTDSVPVPAARRDEAIENARSFAERVGASAGEVDASRVPTYYRPLQGFAVDDRGRLWARLAAPEGGSAMRFDVFDPEGRLLARAEAPVAYAEWRQPLIAGDAMYLVTTDDLGVPYVVRLRIRPGAG
jgi:hypothetical protein